MRVPAALFIATLALPLVACGGGRSESLAQQAENNFEAAAQDAEAMAAASNSASNTAELQVEAERLRQMGEGQAQAIRDADVDPATLTAEAQRNMITPPAN